MDTGSSEMESFFWESHNPAACIRIDEGCGALFDESPGIGVVNPFIDMKRKVVVVLEMR